MISGADVPLIELFQEEARAQTAALTEQLLALEGEGYTPDRLASLMRAAHSLKGAARIVGRDTVVRMAHALEDWFVAAQHRRIVATPEHLDVLLCAVDLMGSAAGIPDEAVGRWNEGNGTTVASLLQALRLASAGNGAALPERSGIRGASTTASAPEDAAPDNGSPTQPVPQARPGPVASPADQRLAAGSLDRLLGLTGDALVASRMLEAHASNARGNRRAQYAAAKAIDALRDALVGIPLDGRARYALATAHRLATELQELRRQRDVALEALAQRIAGVTGQLYQEVLDSRMRAFEEGMVAFPRLVRDVARELGKEARLVVTGGSTRVDREVLRRLDAPLGHLLRNAVDHGIGSAAERRTAGKDGRATITVTARHSGGRLLVAVEDDGRGIDMARLRAAIVDRRHADAAAALAMSDREALEFLFLPGFSLRDEVTALSGRGVGLDAVRTAVHEIGGAIRVTTEPGKGTRFEMQLPLTLSVVRALIVQVAGQACAIPLARIRSVLRVSRDQIGSVEGRQHFSLGGRQVGLLWSHQVMGLPTPRTSADSVAVIVVDDHDRSYGLAVDRLIGEQEIVLRGLDAQLGKVPNVGAAALLPDGAPVLVLDVDDVVRTIANLLDGGRPDPLRHTANEAQQKHKRVLIADDSLTVRELERKLIASRGYDVDVAVDGMDAWNALRSESYDLLVTDVDMPRLDGVELIELVRKDAALRSLPIVIVSYKDREEDRRRGLEAGADYYLTKASFYDETMLRAVEDLIGSAAA